MNFKITDRIIKAGICLSLSGIVLVGIMSYDLGQSYDNVPVERIEIDTFNPWTERVFRVTAYCPCVLCCGLDSDGVTASGHSVKENDGKFIAAPVEYNMGAAFCVPGYHDGEPVPVLDRGGVIKGDRLDVFFPTHQAALNWGVRVLRVRFYNPERILNDE